MTVRSLVLATLPALLAGSPLCQGVLPQGAFVDAGGASGEPVRLTNGLDINLGL